VSAVSADRRPIRSSRHRAIAAADRSESQRGLASALLVARQMNGDIL